MSIDLSKRRKEELAEQYSHLQQRVEQVDYLTHHRVESLFEDVEVEFEEARQRLSDLEATIDQDPTDSQLRRVYRPFVRKLDGIQGRLSDLQQALLYLETHHQQRPAYEDRLDYVSELCNELDELFDHDVEYLPVVWDGYAAFDIEFREFYAVHVPRDESPILGSPVVAHELGHAVVDHMEQTDRQPFYDRLQDFVEEWDEKKQPLVRRTWREWFKELVCDACGVLTFGPAYLLILTERLCHSDPYRLPSRSSSQVHPPDAMRFEFVDGLATEVFPDELYERTDSACDDFRGHLQYSTTAPPPEYDSWKDDELHTAVRDATRTRLDTDIAELCSNILNESDPESAPEQQLRLEVNHRWLERQNGG